MFDEAHCVLVAVDQSQTIIGRTNRQKLCHQKTKIINPILIVNDNNGNCLNLFVFASGDVGDLSAVGQLPMVGR